MIYASEARLRDAREVFFQRAGFPPDGGYDERWIKVRYLGVPVWLPNVENRRRAVPLHDVHHILTEYPTTWRGEAEISAWEVGSGGLGRFWAGWILDLMNVAQGLVINPRGVYAAFMRGRQTANLFGSDFNPRILDKTVGGLRSTLNLEGQLRSSDVGDHIAFVFWTLMSVMVYLAAGFIGCMPLIAVLWLLSG